MSCFHCLRCFGFGTFSYAYSICLSRIDFALPLRLFEKAPDAKLNELFLANSEPVRSPSGKGPISSFSIPPTGSEILDFLASFLSLTILLNLLSSSAYFLASSRFFFASIHLSEPILSPRERAGGAEFYACYPFVRLQSITACLFGALSFYCGICGPVCIFIPL